MDNQFPPHFFGQGTGQRYGVAVEDEVEVFGLGAQDGVAHGTTDKIQGEGLAEGALAQGVQDK